jgi:hypothetical protein
LKLPAGPAWLPVAAGPWWGGRGGWPDAAGPLPAAAAAAAAAAEGARMAGSCLQISSTRLPLLTPCTSCGGRQCVLYMYACMCVCACECPCSLSLCIVGWYTVRSVCM